MKSTNILRGFFFTLAFLALCSDAFSSAPKGLNYSKREVMVKMRDGVSLSTTLYEPLDEYGKTPLVNRPIMLFRTPYGTKPYGEEFTSDYKGMMKSYFDNHYIIVYQSVRGTYLSEGEYENVRPYIIDKKGLQTDESSDTYDTAQWLVENTSNNGCIGVKGTSYPGFYATMAAFSEHPAIKAVSPQAPVTDWFMGDDIQRNGVAFLSDTYSFGGSFFRPRHSFTKVGNSPVVKIEGNLYDFFRGKPMNELMKPLIDSLPFLNEYIQHPSYDYYWKQRNPAYKVKDIKPAVLVVGGTYDAEDCYGPLFLYKKLKKQSPSTETYLVEGPWSHGGWNNLDYSHLGDAYFGSGASAYYLNKIEYPFFAYYLEGKGRKPANATVLPSEETMIGKMKGKNTDDMWVRLDSWPPEGVRMTKFFIDPDGSITETETGDRSESRQYVSDPQNPVSYFETRTTGRGKEYMAGNQKFASERKDVLTYEGEAFSDTMTVAGPVKVHLRTSLSTTDADYVVKVIDVRPDGYQMLVRADIMPARFRKSFSKPQPVKPEAIFELSYGMNDICHRFMPGHRLMVQIQSSWFPLAAMNPQKYLDNPYKAEEKDYQKAEVRIFGNSFIELPVLSR